MGSNTYSSNDDLVLDTGQSVDEFLDNSLTAKQITQMKEKARVRAFNLINNKYLRGRTVIPALHISSLLQIEVDLVIADLMQGAFVLETANTSEWTVKYEERAKEALEDIRFQASAEDPIPDQENTGDGTIEAIVCNDDFTMTEIWLLRATSATNFSVIGSLSGRLPDLTVDTWYPEKDWVGASFEDYGFRLSRFPKFEEFPISLKINSGDTAFVQYDKFKFKTYSASYFKQTVGKILRG